ncbi:MAG: COX15/CtaA family protein [OCS116 cluster bacterium]|uniref:Heme A synthase n=1 Tax=OCS116 cluster bacterium TaxID=2030921 RepID=A0A2A4YYD8_9PROT|nr:COX15/CtaA family protein [OCS116 cluster bacterium]
MQKNILAQQIWLWTICFFIGLMVVVGGATRLTNSGLSITEWKPIMGAIPPLNAQDWLIAFEKYKLIPEYLFEHADMTVESFKSIFWWEWSHRFLGRFVGILWFVPFAYFLVRKQIVKGYMGKYLVLGLLGGAQGVLGWYMVMSGLVERVDVSQYRLAAHLGLAIFLLALSFWYALELGTLRKWNADKPAMPKRKRGVFAWFLLIVIFVQILLGALVAGTDAGMAYNTWPLMGDLFIPDGLYDLMPAWLSVFEDVTTIQFNHRMLAYFIIVLVGVQAVFIYRNETSNEKLRRSLIWVKLALLVQIGLGIMTLLTFVHLHTALAHQIGAVILLMLSINHIYKIAYEYK